MLEKWIAFTTFEVLCYTFPGCDLRKKGGFFFFEGGGGLLTMSYIYARICG